MRIDYFRPSRRWAMIFLLKAHAGLATLPSNNSPSAWTQTCSRWLKTHGRGYQTRINRILRAAMESQEPRRSRSAPVPKKNTRHEVAHRKPEGRAPPPERQQGARGSLSPQSGKVPRRIDRRRRHRRRSGLGLCSARRPANRRAYAQRLLAAGALTGTDSAARLACWLRNPDRQSHVPRDRHHRIP